MNTGENIAYNIIHKNGYIYSQPVQGASSELKENVLFDEGYEVSFDGFRVKLRIVTTKICSWQKRTSTNRIKAGSILQS